MRKISHNIPGTDKGVLTKVGPKQLSVKGLEKRT
jgi:hypothetical protein